MTQAPTPAAPTEDRIAAVHADAYERVVLAYCLVTNVEDTGNGDRNYLPRRAVAITADLLGRASEKDMSLERAATAIRRCVTGGWLRRELADRTNPYDQSGSPKPNDRLILTDAGRAQLTDPPRPIEVDLLAELEYRFQVLAEAADKMHGNAPTPNGSYGRYGSLAEAIGEAVAIAARAAVAQGNYLDRYAFAEEVHAAALTIFEEAR